MMVNLAYADKVAMPVNVGEMIEEDSDFAPLKEVEIALQQLGESTYLISLTKIPRFPASTAKIPIVISSQVAACLADYLSFKDRKKFWSVGYSWEALAINEYGTSDTERHDYYVFIGKKPDKSFKDMAGREIDRWKDRDSEYLFTGHKKKICERHKIRSEWLSSWETYRAPNSYLDVAGEKLPNRLWAFHKNDVVDTWSKSEDMLPISNADVLIRAINPKLYSLKISFDWPVRAMAVMYSLMAFPSCLAHYLSDKQGFEASDVGLIIPAAKNPAGKPENSDDMSSVEFYLLLDVRENEPRPGVAEAQKIGWIGESASVATLRAVQANNSKTLCRKIMLDEYVVKR